MGIFGGSLGKAEAQKLQYASEFHKYAEDDNEDYDDVFGKANGSCMSLDFTQWHTIDWD